MDQKQQIAEKLKQVNNILVTVSNNPSVDQLAACIGLALALNKLGKHATAVFSGDVPSTIEFLRPEETLEDNVDSLRDFIISLDKSKADKLRYKVEDKVVKIFITPYRTSISEKDLEFGQGDFNVDAVVALGVQNQADIDEAIAAHGRILHDAVVMTLNVVPGGEFGSINWVNPGASGVCELVAELLETLDKQLIDPQIATALLTGIVAETNRFSNSKTTPATMSMSAALMAAGANQQLVVTELETAVAPPAEPAPVSEQPAPEAANEVAADGELKIRKDDEPTEAAAQPAGDAAEPAEEVVESPEQVESTPAAEQAKTDEENKPVASLEDLAGSGDSQQKKEPELTRIHIDEQGRLHTLGKDHEEKPEPTTDPTRHVGSSRMILHPPSMGDGGLMGDSYSDPLTAPKSEGSEAGQSAAAPASSPFQPPASASITPPPAPFMPPSMAPGPVEPPAASAPAAAPAAAGPSTPPDLVPSPADSTPGVAGDAAPAATPAPSSPLDLNVPLPAGAPLPTSGPNIPEPVGPPPPVPPPMIPGQ